MGTILWIYLAVINLTAFAMMGSDKRKAKRRSRRTPEARFFWMAAAGGALGVLVGMNRFRHKTLHSSFQFGIPLLLIWNAIALGYLLTVVY